MFCIIDILVIMEIEINWNVLSLLYFFNIYSHTHTILIFCYFFKVLKRFVKYYWY